MLVSFSASNYRVHLHVGFFLLKRFFGKLRRSHDACFERIRVFGEEPVVVALAVPLSAPVPIELDAGNQEYGNVAFEHLDSFAGFHDPIVSLDQVLLEIAYFVKVHDAVALAFGEQQAAFDR